MDEQSTVLTCDICGDYECDTAQKLSVHKHHCAKKQESVTTDAQDVSQEDTRQPRKKRIPFGEQETRLPYGPSDDGFHYRVFNDNWTKEPGRVQRAKDAGYVLVDTHRSGMAVGHNEDGSIINGVLMRIPQELHDEDMAKKEARLFEVDKQIYGGDYKKTENDGRYIPKEGISMDNKLTP